MDGWWDNELRRSEGPDTENWYGRASLLFDASETLEIIAAFGQLTYSPTDRVRVQSERTPGGE
jgi:hypothetical protein